MWNIINQHSVFAHCCLISLITNSGSVARVLLFNLTGDRDPNRLLKPIMVCGLTSFCFQFEAMKERFIITVISAKSIIILDMAGH